MSFVGIPEAAAVWMIAGLRVPYRIARGGTTLSAGGPMPLPEAP